MPAPVTLRGVSSTSVSRRRSDFPYFHHVRTRWMDLDAYGHVNNAEYFSYFDSAVNSYLIQEAGLQPSTDPIVAYVIRNECTFKQQIRFPESLEIGIRVQRLGGTSVAYEIAIYKDGIEEPAAEGVFVNVYVDRATSTPVPIPERHRTALQRLCPPE